MKNLRTIEVSLNTSKRPNDAWNGIDKKPKPGGIFDPGGKQKCYILRNWFSYLIPVMQDSAKYSVLSEEYCYCNKIGKNHCKMLHDLLRQVIHRVNIFI